jgi:hypothetical protein
MSWVLAVRHPSPDRRTDFPRDRTEQRGCLKEELEETAIYLEQPLLRSKYGTVITFIFQSHLA